MMGLWVTSRDAVIPMKENINIMFVEGVFAKTFWCRQPGEKLCHV
jgi:hypothetical protein